MFLAMSSMLAVYHLLPELEGSCSSSTRPAAIEAGNKGMTPGCATLACDSRHSRDKANLASIPRAVLRYYARRVRRIVPAYATANLLILLLVAAARHAQQTAGGLSPLAAAAKDFCFTHCPSGMWANALFVMHFLGRQGCGECWWGWRGPVLPGAGLPYHLVTHASWLRPAPLPPCPTCHGTTYPHAFCRAAPVEHDGPSACIPAVPTGNGAPPATRPRLPCPPGSRAGSSCGGRVPLEAAHGRHCRPALSLQRSA